MSSPLMFGMDMGGTKIEAAAMASDGAIVARRRMATPDNYEATLAAMTGLLAALEAEVGARATHVGIASPGSISPRTGVMRNCNATWVNGKPFGADLELALRRPVRLANDANCFALSEAIDGAAAGAQVTFGVIIGTGCGGGLVVRNRLVEGANGIGGEWGHNPLPWPTDAENPGPRCWCGKHGCLETWISGTGLRDDFRRIAGRDLPGEAIIAAARDGDAHASLALEQLIDRLARSLAVICNLVDPDAIVFGGGLSNVSEIYARLPARIAQHVFSDIWEAKLLAAKWGDSSGVRGAARLWADGDQHD